MTLLINGQQRELVDLVPGSSLAALVAVLGFKGDRIAIEHNGTIVPRAGWENTALASHDKLEIVQFVGGGHTGARL